MKLEIIVLAITGLLLANAYYDGKYLKLLLSWKKYYQMFGIAFMGISVYWFMKKNPNDSRSLISHATNFVKYMPLDKDANSLVNTFANNPLLQTMPLNNNYNQNNNINAQRRMMQSGKSTKRSVSETKKKYVASQQQWRCGDCNEQLTAWFEVDHKVRLEHGGTNELNNLIALCRNCHGKKTAMENL
jgi:5-methylcytosine-specific restriction endonuclease McrA